VSAESRRIERADALRASRSSSLSILLLSDIQKEMSAVHSVDLSSAFQPSLVAAHALAGSALLANQSITVDLAASLRSVANSARFISDIYETTRIANDTIWQLFDLNAYRVSLIPTPVLGGELTARIPEIVQSTSKLTSTVDVSQRYLVAADASTLPVDELDPGLSIKAEKELWALIASGEETLDFDDNGDFTEGLLGFVFRYRMVGLRLFERFCLTEGANPFVIGEGLRVLGQLDEDPFTHNVRLQLLRKCLNHPLSVVRDAAGVGLTLLGDRRAIPSLENALRRETRPLCRQTLEKALAELQR